MNLNVSKNANVTKEEADNIVALFKHYLSNPSFHAFDDYEQERFFEMVSDVYITTGDNAYLDGTTFIVGCDASTSKIMEAFQMVMHVHYYKKFPKEEKKDLSGSGSCYIATACYGSYDCPQVLTFRNFRDNCLAQTILGRVFIKTYYALSPSIARWLRNKRRINTFVRVNILNPIYELLSKKSF